MTSLNKESYFYQDERLIDFQKRYYCLKSIFEKTLLQGINVILEEIDQTQQKRKIKDQTIKLIENAFNCRFFLDEQTELLELINNE